MVSALLCESNVLKGDGPGPSGWAVYLQVFAGSTAEEEGADGEVGQRLIPWTGSVVLHSNQKVQVDGFLLYSFGVFLSEGLKEES
jgi:hypothetical protein